MGCHIKVEQGRAIMPAPFFTNPKQTSNETVDNTICIRLSSVLHNQLSYRCLDLAAGEPPTLGHANITRHYLSVYRYSRAMYAHSGNG